MKFFQWTITLKREENRLTELEEARKLLYRCLGNDIIYYSGFNGKGTWAIKDQKKLEDLFDDIGDFLEVR